MLYTYKAIVSRVVDGDTVDLILDLGFNMSFKARFRVAGFNAPETYRPESGEEYRHGIEASAYARILLPEKSTVAVTTTKDVGIYGRYSASIELKNGSDFVECMKAEGYEKQESY